MLSESGLIQQEQLPQTEVTGRVEEIRTMVVEGTTYFCIRLVDQDVFYAISAASYPEIVTLDPGDRVKIEHQIAQEGESL